MTVEIVSIVLNYNSLPDTLQVVSDLLKQKAVNQKIFVIDNFSNDRERIIYEFSKKFDKRFELIDFTKVPTKSLLINNFSLDKSKDIFIILNNENKGYSAGNNLGIILAQEFYAQTVLIINPDVRIPNELSLKKLLEVLKSKNEYIVAGPIVFDKNNNIQSPLRESKFLEEFTWFLNKKLKRTYVIQQLPNYPIKVPKISGCCMLIKMELFKSHGLLDENVFMYSEEAILSKIVEKIKKSIVVVPSVHVIHLHKNDINKKQKAKKMIMFLKSRLYYIWKYSDYSFLEKLLISFSYGILYLTYKMKILLLKEVI